MITFGTISSVNNITINLGSLACNSNKYVRNLGFILNHTNSFGSEE